MYMYIVMVGINTTKAIVINTLSHTSDNGVNGTLQSYQVECSICNNHSVCVCVCVCMCVCVCVCVCARVCVCVHIP